MESFYIKEYLSLEIINNRHTPIYHHHTRKGKKEISNQQSSIPSGDCKGDTGKKICKTMNPCLNGGGSSLISMCIIQCMDIIKVHNQWGQSYSNVENNMFTYEVFGDFYKGFYNGFLRQANYTTTHLRTFRSTMLSHTIFALVFVKGDISIVEYPTNENNGDNRVKEMTISTF